MRTGAVLLALGLTVLGASEGRATEAAFPGRPGRIVFVSDRASSTAELATSNADGTGRRTITHHAPFAFDPVPSPDGARLAFVVKDPFTDRDSLWVASARGARPRPLVRDVSPVTPRDLAWSRDGRRLAYVAYGGLTDRDIWIVGLDGRRRRLTATPESDTQPRWSPDGSLIAFVRAEGPDDAIWLARTDGGGERRLAAGSSPEWSPRDDEIVFERPDTRSLVVASADSASLRELAPGEDPAWSSDGRLIAYVRPARRGCAACLSSLEVVRPDATGARRILGPSAHAHLPAWSSRGEIAFVVATPTRYGVDLVRADGRRHRHAFPRLRDLQGLFPALRDRRRFLANVEIGPPSWARRGKIVVFGLDNFDFDYQAVYAVDASSGRGRSLFGHAPGSDTTPSWSADGRSIAYTRDNYQLWVRAGTRERRIAEGWSPAWSPDGRRIVVENPVSCDRIVTVATGKSQGIHCDGAEFGTSPAWSPDGRWIAYIGSNPDGEIRLYSPRTGAIRGLRVFAESDLAWSPDGRRLAYTAELRGCGSGPCRGVYLLDVARRKSRLLVVDGSEAAWSPDGRALVFVRRGSLHVVGADGTRQRRLTYSGHDFSPNWQPLRPYRG